jgi:hypothetical protein
LPAPKSSISRLTRRWTVLAGVETSGDGLVRQSGQHQRHEVRCGLVALAG